MLYFWKAKGPRTSKWYSGLSNTQIHIYRYTNTQTHKYSIWERVRNTQHILIFLKSQWSKDNKNDILDCQIHKYTNTKTQIHKYTVMKCRKYPTCAIFSKSQGSKDIKNDILDCQKYKYTRDAITTYHQIWNYESLTTDWLLHCTTRFIITVRWSSCGPVQISIHPSIPTRPDI